MCSVTELRTVIVFHNSEHAPGLSRYTLTCVFRQIYYATCTQRLRLSL